MANEHDYEKDFERELFADVQVIPAGNLQDVYDAGYRWFEIGEQNTFNIPTIQE